MWRLSSTPGFSLSDVTVSLCDIIMTDVRVILGSLSDFLGDGSVSCIPSSSARYSGCIFLIFANTEERRGEERR